MHIKIQINKHRCKGGREEESEKILPSSKKFIII